jgi:hypothetical protein
LRRLASSFLVTLVALAAALSGAAAFAAPTERCLSVTSDAMTQAIQASEIIVIGEVRGREDGAVAIHPEAFLKGAAQAEDLVLHPTEATENCPSATLGEGARVLAFLVTGSSGVAWPSQSQVFLLEGGVARHQAPAGDDPLGDRPESQLVSLVRHTTEQYAIPAEDGTSGAGIDWWKTVVPVTAATLGLLAVGLYLMRIWHRIDPS